MKILNKELKDRKKIIFFDLEGTQTSKEIIAIGAIKATLDAKNDILKYDKKGFSIYVKAQNKIGYVVMRLTKISEDTLHDKGVPFNKAIDSLRKYIGKNPENYTYIAYGNYDKTLLYETSVRNDKYGYDLVEIISHNYFDYAKFMTKFIKNETGQTPSLVDAILALDGKPTGNIHNALCDTQNLLYLYKLVKENRSTLKLRLKEAFLKTSLPTPVLNILKKLNSNQNVTPIDYDQYIDDYLK